MTFIPTSNDRTALETRPLPSLIRVPRSELQSLKEEFQKYFEFEKERLLSDKSFFESLSTSDLDEALSAELEKYTPIAENVLSSIVSLSETTT